MVILALTAPTGQCVACLPFTVTTRSSRSTHTSLNNGLKSIRLTWVNHSLQLLCWPWPCRQDPVLTPLQSCHPTWPVCPFPHTHGQPLASSNKVFRKRLFHRPKEVTCGGRPSKTRQPCSTLEHGFSPASHPNLSHSWGGLPPRVNGSLGNLTSP